MPVTVKPTLLALYQLMNANERIILLLVWLLNNDLEHVWEEITSFKLVEYLIIYRVGEGGGG